VRVRNLMAAILTAASFGAGPASQPATAPADSALWAKLLDIDSRAGRVRSLAATFQQQKFTALLRKPLVSDGRVRIRGAVMRWDTQRPEPSVLLIDEHEARVYYPAQKTMEIYPLDKRLGELAASPLPRLEVLRSRFSFAQFPVSEIDRSADGKRFIALLLMPMNPSLRQYVSQVRVLLDVPSAYVREAEVTDADGDRSLLSFSDVQLNVDVGNLDLTVPPGTKVTHPLEGLEGAPGPQTQGKSK